MKLNDIISGQFSAAEWEAKGYQLPKFDIKAVREKTAKEPTWVHFGGGNIFRAFPAAILNDALNTGKYDRGVIVAETFDFEVIDKAYAPLTLRQPLLRWLYREEGHRQRNRSPQGRPTVRRLEPPG